MAIWQDLVDDHGFAARYASVRASSCAARHDARRGARRDHHGARRRRPGRLRRRADGARPETGKYRRTRLFVLTLGYSRKCVRLLTWRRARRSGPSSTSRRFVGWAARSRSSSSTTWAKACSRRTSTIRRSIRSIATCSRTTASSRCRVASAIPIAKGKVEAGVGHAQKTPLKGLRFETLEAAQAYLDRWETHWADTRIHGTTKRQVAAMFAEERPALGPLPSNRFATTASATRTVHLDGCVEVEAAYYGAPPGWIGQRVQVQWNDLHVRLLDRRRPASCCASICARAAAGIGSTTTTGRRARRPRRWRCWRARPAGPHIGTVCTHIHAARRRAGVRRILGVLALAKKHGPAVVDDAAKAALEIGVPTYRFLRKYLERRRPCR
jgi:hypothetical protein